MEIIYVEHTKSQDGLRLHVRRKIAKSKRLKVNGYFWRFLGPSQRSQVEVFLFCQHKGTCVKSSDINSIIAKSRGKCTAQEVVEAASSKLAELFGYEIVRLPADPKSAKKAREEERKRQIDLEKRKQREEEAARKAEAQGRQAKKQNPKPKKPAISGWSFALFYNRVAS